MASAPNLVRRRLGRRLSRLRHRASMTPQQVNDANISISKSKLRLIELGESPKVAFGDVLALCRIYQVDDKKIENELTRMAQATTERGWWEPYGKGVPAWFQLFVELEQDADSLDIHEVEFVNGLFQTEEYMRAVIAANPSMDKVAAEKAVALRLARQRDFWKRMPLPEVNLIMGEAAIKREVAGSVAHRAQLDLLLDKAGFPGIHLWVIPSCAGAHASMNRSYTMMQFADPDDPSVVYTESIDGCRYDDTAEMFTLVRDTFNATKIVAEPIEEHLK